MDLITEPLNLKTEPLKRSDELELYDYIYEIRPDSDKYENVYQITHKEGTKYCCIHVIKKTKFELDLSIDDITYLQVLKIHKSDKRRIGLPDTRIL